MVLLDKAHTLFALLRRKRILMFIRYLNKIYNEVQT
jgi:hypothetical protein